MIPKKIGKGSHLRVIAPSLSFSIISDGLRQIAKKRFSEFGIELSFGKHIEEKNDFNSTNINSCHN